jgi:hydroxymethylbilane synthase
MISTDAVRTLRLGTRGSVLALRQTRHVAALLRVHDPALHVSETIIGTRGDRDAETPLQEIGAKGVFTEDLSRALREGEIDAAVHSLKDVPVEPAAGLVIAAVCARVDPRDALISRTYDSLAALPAGATVGTSSARRTAQILAARPELRIVPLRGNVETRIEKARSGAPDAIVVAAAGLIRLGLEDEIREWLAPDPFLPAPGQAALAVQCRADDRTLLALCRLIDEPLARAETTAERAFLAALGGGCSMPISALARADAVTSRLRMRGAISARDGSRTIVVHNEGAMSEATAVGMALAAAAERHGAHGLLA